MSLSDPGPGGGLPPNEVRSGLQRLPSPARFLEEIFLHASVGLQIYDRNGRCVLVNPMHTRLFGTVPPPDYNIFEDTILVERGVAGLVRRAFAGERISVPPIWYDARELRNVKVEGPGRRLAVAAELVPLRAGTGAPDTGEVTHVLFVFQDVTELHRAREEAEAARLAAEAANRTKDEFLAMLGHELRNPLAPMVTALELSRRRGAASPELEIIERQVGHLRLLIEDLLDVSRITQGKLELHPQVFELCEAVAQGVELARPLLEQRQQELQVDCPEHGMPVHADRDRLAQIVCNLLSNAARYTPAGGHVALRGEREDATIVLRVRDDGIGMEPALLQRIFEPFSQGKQTLERSGGGGLGLGLAIVKSLAERHGGSVSAHSDGPDRGSEFEVRLPAAQAPDAPPAVEAAQPREEEPAAAGARILVVDDNEDAADLMAEMLQLYGYEASAVYHPMRALEMALQLQPDVAFIDIGLPEFDGHELARRLRSHAVLAGMRMVALTGYGQASDREQAARAGFDAHLTKPAEVDDVLKLIATLLPAAQNH